MNRFQQAFTIIEVLISIAILGIIIAIVTLSFSGLAASKALEESVNTTISIFDEARSLTLASKGNSQYGLNLQSSQITLFKGASYSASDPNNVITRLNSQVAIRNISLAGGGSNVVFNKLTGETDEPGTLELYLLASTTNYRVITISPTGLVQ